VILFDSGRAGGPGLRDIYEARRATTAAQWSAPTVVTELSSPSLDTLPGISADALTILFASDRPGGLGFRDIYTASRSDLASPFTSPQIVSELNSDSTDLDPWVSADLRYVVFASGRSGNQEIYEAWR